MAGGRRELSESISLHVVCALASSDNELKMTPNGEQIDLIKLLVCLLRASPARLQRSVALCLRLFLLSGDSRLPDIARIETRFSRRGQIDYGLDARGLCVCWGPVCFEK